MKKQDIQSTILLIVELFSVLNVVFYICVRMCVRMCM